MNKMPEKEAPEIISTKVIPWRFSADFDGDTEGVDWEKIEVLVFARDGESYEIVGGKLESDISPKENLANETKEEIGKTIDPKALAFLGRIKRILDRDGKPEHRGKCMETQFFTAHESELKGAYCFENDPDNDGIGTPQWIKVSELADIQSNSRKTLQHRPTRLTERLAAAIRSQVRARFEKLIDNETVSSQVAADEIKASVIDVRSEIFALTKPSQRIKLLNKYWPGLLENVSSTDDPKKESWESNSQALAGFNEALNWACQYAQKEKYPINDRVKNFLFPEHKSAAKKNSELETSQILEIIDGSDWDTKAVETWTVLFKLSRMYQHIQASAPWFLDEKTLTQAYKEFTDRVGSVFQPFLEKALGGDFELDIPQEPKSPGSLASKLLRKGDATFEGIKDIFRFTITIKDNNCDLKELAAKLVEAANNRNSKGQHPLFSKILPYPDSASPECNLQIKNQNNNPSRGKSQDKVIYLVGYFGRVRLEILLQNSAVSHERKTEMQHRSVYELVRDVVNRDGRLIGFVDKENVETVVEKLSKERVIQYEFFGNSIKIPEVLKGVKVLAEHSDGSQQKSVEERTKERIYKRIKETAFLTKDGCWCPYQQVFRTWQDLLDPQNTHHRHQMYRNLNRRTQIAMTDDQWDHFFSDQADFAKDFIKGKITRIANDQDLMEKLKKFSKVVNSLPGLDTTRFTEAIEKKIL